MSFVDSCKKKLASVKDAADKTPDEFIGSGFKKYFAGYEKDAKRILIVTVITCFFCYFYEMITGYGCPDTLSEGVFYYRNADFATSLARWFVKYLNLLVGRNVVIPVIIIPLYCLGVGYSVFLICKMFNIRSALSQVLLTAVSVSFPVVLHHFAFMYIALTYSFSFLMTVVGTKLIREKKVAGFIFGVIAYIFMLGSYQSYIGAISALAFTALIYDMCTMKKVSESLLSLVKIAVAGLVACVVDLPISSYMASKAYGLNPRASFSFSAIIDNISFSLQYSYKWFFSFFFGKDILGRKKLYAVLIAVFAVMVILFIVKLVKNKKYANAAVLLVSVLLLPIAMNLCLIIFPTNGMKDLMRYQYILVFVMIFFFFEHEGGRIYNNLMRYVAYLCVACLISGNVVSANATAHMYRISYEYSVKQGEIMVSKLYELEEYKRNETPVILTGAIDISHLISRYSMIFNLSENEGGPVFWNGIFGADTCRYHFFYDYLGMDFKEYPMDNYYRIIDSEEFKAMPVWPAEGSVAMIDGYAVIKMGEEPFR